MLNLRKSRPSALSLVILLQLFILYPIFSAAIRVTPSSQCAAVCGPDPDQTTPDDITCFDNEFSSTTNGSRFQKCVECELESTKVDNATGITDVLWGIYNLRYAVSTCIYGFPEAKTSLSTPCQVSCASLAPAVEYNIQSNASDASVADLSFCNLPSWSETVVNKCVYCYNWTSTERYMSNFLQSLHNACRTNLVAGSPFPIAATQIFSPAEVSAPPTSSPSANGGGLGTKLKLVIALPVVFGSIFILTIGICCGLLVCKRRRLMAASGNMERFHAGTWQDQNVAAIYGQRSPRGAPSPQWAKHSPGFATQRNSGMGWAQPMGPVQSGKRNSRSSNGSYYEGWGNTFSSTSPRDWTREEQVHERYFPAPATKDNTEAAQAQAIAQAQAQALAQAQAQALANDLKVDRYSWSSDKKSATFANSPPPQFSNPAHHTNEHDYDVKTSSPPELNLTIPTSTLPRPPGALGRKVSGLSPDSEYENDYKFSPYHDLSSPESAAHDKLPGRGQTFSFDERIGKWTKDDGDKKK